MTTGYLTYAQLVNLKLNIDRANLDSEQINHIIESDVASPAKRAMIAGQNYYDARHDILQVVKYIWQDGEKVIDNTVANNRLIHPFHKILVDQKVAYVVGNPVMVSVMSGDTEAEKRDAEAFQAKLDPYIDEAFDDLLNDWVKDSANKGVSFVHPYISESNDPSYRATGRLDTVLIPSEQCIPIYESKYQRELVGMIRYYTYEIVIAGKSETRYKVEWWDKDSVTYWIQTSDKRFAMDMDGHPVNPAPHWSTVVMQNDGTVVSREAGSWGRVPFIALPNNSEWHTDLMPIKTLQDAYDLVKSGWMNNIDDFSDLIYVVKNFSGISEEARKGLSELAAIMHNIKTHRVVRVDGEGGVDALKAEIPTEAREKFLQITRKEIFFFGEGVDVDSDKLGNSPSGVALQFMYSGLDLKANRTIRKAKNALKEYFWFLTAHINRVKKTNYDSSRIVATFNKAQIFNAVEKMDALSKDTVLSRKTKLEQHPYVDDVEEELRRIDEEKATTDPPPVQ